MLHIKIPIIVGNEDIIAWFEKLQEVRHRTLEYECQALREDEKENNDDTCKVREHVITNVTDKGIAW